MAAGFHLIYAWTLTSSPPGAESFGSSEPTTGYMVTLAGTYVFSLSVVDDLFRISSQKLSVTVVNAPPKADIRGTVDVMLARTDVTVTVPTTTSLLLDGTASSDPNGESLTYQRQLQPLLAVRGPVV